MSPPPVTSTTAVVPPRPHNPPINNAPPLRTRLTPTPGPDIQLMVPDAIPKVAAINKIEAENPDIEGGGDFGPVTIEPTAWRLYNHFLNPPAPITDPRSWPVADPLTLYLMAILARFSYQPPSDFRDLAQEAILEVLGERYTFRRVTGDINHRDVSLDIWRAPSEAQIIVIQGTTSLTEWINSSLAGWAAVPGVSTDLKVYYGIRRSADRVLPYLQPEVVSSDLLGLPTILVGHSLGGAIAQLHTVTLDAAYRALKPDAKPGEPISAQYSFGAPAWAGETSTVLPLGWLDRHCRCYLPADPIPYATRAAILRAAGISAGVQLLMTGKIPAVEGTKHYANKSIELEQLNSANRAKVREKIWKSLVEHDRRLLQAVTDAHAVSSYSDACYWRAQRTTEKGKLNSLINADRWMDQYELTYSDRGRQGQ